MVILWTDALIFLLLAVMLMLGFYMRKQAHIKRPLQQIARSKTGMVSLVVLVFFTLIGLLDSVHFKSASSNDIVSVLDVWATPLREQGEKTYSAPFAAYLYSKEMMMQADGTQLWGYPRLQFGGSHLTDPETQKLRRYSAKSLLWVCAGCRSGAFLYVFVMECAARTAQALHEQFHGQNSVGGRVYDCFG